MDADEARGAQVNDWSEAYRQKERERERER